jgi:hypothetical protein
MSDRGWNSVVPARRESVSEAEVDGELVLLDTTTGALHVLNRTAALVWSELDGSRQVDAIVSELSDVAGAEEERVRQDVISYLEDLEDKGLLSRVPPAP